MSEPDKKVKMLHTHDCIDDFLCSLREKGASENTLRAYRADLTGFLKQTQTTCEQFSHEWTAREAAKWLTEKRLTLAPATIARKLAALRKFGQFHGCAGFLADYYAPTPAKGQAHPIPEGPNGVMEMLECTRGFEQAALVALCGLVGLRISEARMIRATHVDLQRRQLTVRGKGDKTRIIPIGQRAMRWIEPAVIVAMNRPNNRLVPYSDRYARQLITDIAARAGLSTVVSSHDMRHTFGTAAYGKTKNIRAVQKLLGHTNIATTEIYVGVDMDEMREAAEIA